MGNYYDEADFNSETGEADFYSEAGEEGFFLSAEPEAAFEINRDLHLARRIVESTGSNLFLTGKAGTGKTTFLRRLRETCSKRMVVLAPTGVAAINANGVTIHSFFQLSFAPYIPGVGFADNERRFGFSREKRKLMASMDLLVIDEISMVRPDVLDAIDSVLRRHRDSTRPFGGVQLLLIGDLRQLAPVVQPREWELLAPHYNSPYFFESHALRQAGFTTIELRTVYRQSDAAFVEILNAVREGTATTETLRSLNSRYCPAFNPSDNEGYIRLTTHNAAADNINRARLDALPGPGVTYTARIKGSFPQNSCPADMELTLKPGARVMFIKNDQGEDRRFYNGMLATVVSTEKEFVRVAPADGSEEIDVEPMDWENTKYSMDESTNRIIEEVEGTFTQLPLRPAWAITIHKSQGLTFERAIIDASHSFAPGQTYVALSRCRSLAGMVLSAPLTASAVITDGTVNSFIDECNRQRPSAEDVERMRDDYLRRLLSDLFGFRPLRMAYESFHRYVKEYFLPTALETAPAFDKAARILSERIEAVGDRFLSLYSPYATTPEALAADMRAMAKIHSGCGYFAGEIENCIDQVAEIDVTVGNKAYNKTLSGARELWLRQMFERLWMLRLMEGQPFTPEVMLEKHAEAVAEADRQTAFLLRRGTRSRKRLDGNSHANTAAVAPVKEKKAKKEKEKEKKEKKPKNYSVFETLGLFRAGKSPDEIAAERSLKPYTIIGHLATAVELGAAQLTELIPAPHLESMDRAAGIIKQNATPDPEWRPYSEFVSALDANIPEWETLVYWKIKKPVESVRQ